MSQPEQSTVLVDTDSGKEKDFPERKFQPHINLGSLFRTKEGSEKECYEMC